MENLLLNIGAAYIRVSDERQDEYSPASQLSKIREYAAKEGYQIPDEYVYYDDGISGKLAAKRGDFNRMIAATKEKNPPFSVIYVWKFSRFARNQEESMVYKNLLRKKNISVVSVSEPVPEGPFGSLVERIIEWTDEYYLVALVGEVTRGMTEKVSRGEPTCAPPYGYIMKDKKYYPDEESGAAAIVREIFTRFVEGGKQREIAISLGERGVRTRFGNPPDARFIEYVLNNPCYIGYLRWTTGGLRALNAGDFNNENIQVIKGNHEPIISEELWQAAQARLRELKMKYSKYARRTDVIQYSLKGLVKCGACGSTLTSGIKSGSKNTIALQCCNYARGVCKVSHYITVPKLEAAVISGLKAAVESGEFTIIPQETKPAEAPAIDYNKLIEIEERKLARAKDAYLAEIDTLEQYRAAKEAISEKIAELKARQKSEIKKTFDVKKFGKKVAKVLAFIESDGASPQAKNEMLRTIINKIVYEKSNGNLAIYFHDI